MFSLVASFSIGCFYCKFLAKYQKTKYKQYFQNAPIIIIYELWILWIIGSEFLPEAHSTVKCEVKAHPKTSRPYKQRTTWLDWRNSSITTALLLILLSISFALQIERRINSIQIKLNYVYSSSVIPLIQSIQRQECLFILLIRKWKLLWKNV